MTPQERKAQFLREYRALCEATGYQLASAYLTIQSGHQTLTNPVTVPVPNWTPAEDAEDDEDA